jgi:choline-sulfatase
MLRKLLDSPWTYFAGAGLLGVLAIASQFELRLRSRSVEGVEAIETLRERADLNVVLILVDTLRADRLGVYGYPRPTSPTLDALARNGAFFTRVVSQSSWTKTSMASLWTAATPARHGILRYQHALPEAALLPAELLRQAGFRTAGIWRNGWVAPNFGFGQGFEVYLRPKPGRERAQIQRNHPSAPALQGTDEDVVASAVEFLENFGDQRFFLYLHFMDVHQYVFDEDAAVFGTSYSDSYDQAINWTDRLVAFFVEHLEESGLLDDTLILIASDHGEAFLEHGLEGHARNLHREVVYVPLIFSFPFLLEPGLQIDAVVSNLDLWPTVLDLLGLPPLPSADGVSLMPLLLGASGVAPPATDAIERPAFSQLDRGWGRPNAQPDPLVAVTAGDLRLFLPVHNPDGAELYDLGEDPVESRNLAQERPDAAAPLRALASDYLEAAKSPWGAEPDEVKLDHMRLEQLRALGYVIR